MTTVTYCYCESGHLWDPEPGQRCHQCAAEEQGRALDLIREIEQVLDRRRTGSVRERLRLLREILTD